MIDVGYCTQCDAPLKVGAATCPVCGLVVELENDQNEGE